MILSLYAVLNGPVALKGIVKAVGKNKLKSVPFEKRSMTTHHVYDVNVL